jgi:hypothetical protein
MKIRRGRYVKTQLSLYLFYKADDVFQPLWAILRSQKCIMKEKLYSVRSLIVVHILNFQRDHIVVRFIHIELIICLTIKVDRVQVHIHVVRDVL